MERLYAGALHKHLSQATQIRKSTRTEPFAAASSGIANLFPLRAKVCGNAI
jgi:hypothetical protein